MELADKLTNYFNSLDGRLNIRIKEPFPTYYPECEEFKECYIYSVFFDKENKSTSIVEIVHYFNEDLFGIITDGVKEVDNVNHVLIILNEFFMK